MKQIINTLNKLKRFISNDEDFKYAYRVANSTLTNKDSFKSYYQGARQLKNLNGFNGYINDWFNHLKDNPQYVALLDKRYLDCSYVVINGNIIDLDSLYLDFKSDLRSYYGLNPTSL